MKDNFNIIIVGVGGQGILTSAEIIGIAGIVENKQVISSEVHGMAQRGGVVVCEVKIGYAKSPLIAEGAADVILGFEPSETYRILNRGNNKTAVITNIFPVIPFTVSLGKSVYPDVGLILENIKKVSNNLIAFDAFKLAKEAGSVLSGNIVMLGALSALNNFPLKKASMIEAIKQKIKPSHLDMNLKAFELGSEVVVKCREQFALSKK